MRTTCAEMFFVNLKNGIKTFNSFHLEETLSITQLFLAKAAAKVQPLTSAVIAGTRANTAALGLFMSTNEALYLL